MEASRQPAPIANVSRPRSVTILAWLLLMQSLFVLGDGIFLMIRSPDSRFDADQILQILPFAVSRNLSLPAVVFVLAGAGVITAVAVWNLRSWSWMAALILQGFSMASALVAYMQGYPNYVAMAVGILLVLYLNYQEVQEALSGKRGQ